jgi:excisionase family DNA binding protein
MTTTAPLDTTAPPPATQPAEQKPPRQHPNLSVGQVKASHTPPVLLSVQHTCARYGMSRSYLYRLIGDRQVATRKLGRRILIVVESVDAYVATLPPADIRPDRRSRQRAASDAATRTAVRA